MAVSPIQESLPPASAGELARAKKRRKRNESTSLTADAWYRLTRNKSVVASMVFVTLLVAVCLVAPVLGLPAPTAQDLGNMNQGPSGGHVLGTDELGRDMLSRLIYGARVSLLVGLGVQILTALIGTLLGLIAGYYGGIVDTIVMRFVDTMYAFPPFLFAVFMAAVLPSSVWSILFVLTLVGWPWNARVTRSLTLSLKESEYVTAARVVGASSWRIMIRHILPNSLSPIIVGFSIGMAGTIMAEAGLSFLGIGIRPPTPSWGGMIDKGRAYLQVYPHLALYPSIALAITTLAFNFLGDGLRDALDPRMKSQM